MLCAAAPFRPINPFAGIRAHGRQHEARLSLWNRWVSLGLFATPQDARAVRAYAQQMKLAGEFSRCFSAPAVRERLKESAQSDPKIRECFGGPES